MRKWTDPIVSSHALFLVNALLWWRVGSPECGVLLVMSCAASVGHHLLNEQSVTMGDIDRALALWALAGTVCYTAQYMNVGEWVNCAILLGGALLCKMYGDRSGSYRIWHTLWHIMVFVGQAYLAYLCAY